MRCEFLYKSDEGEIGKIIKEGREVEDCIISFETDHPNWTWRQVAPLIDID